MSITVPLYGFGGAGIPLNFKVVDGTAEPSNPRENTIWLNTEKKITGYHFSVTQPKDMAEGEVWITIGTSSSVEFNALKKDSIQVYPVSAKQFINGELVNVTAKTYQNGAWKDWFTVFIQSGVEMVEFELHTGVSGNSIVVEKTKETDSIVYVLSSSSLGYGACGMYYKSIDLTNINTIEINASSVSDSQYAGTPALTVLSELPGDTSNEAFGGVTVASADISSASMTTVSLDVSALTGVHPVGLLIFTGYPVTLTVTDFRCV